MERLRGAYVQAWVWVDLDGNDDDYTDDDICDLARDKWEHEGELEIDRLPPIVSRSYGEEEPAS